MGLYKAPQFKFKCSDCNYHATVKGLWAVITRYPDHSAYTFLCASCDMKKSTKREEVSA